MNGVETGDALPVTVSVNSMSKFPASSPSTSVMRARAASSPRPGGTRQSIFSVARDGITLILSDA
jgi:hypothetical protein